MSQQPSFATPVPAALGALAVTAFLLGALFLGKIMVPAGLFFVGIWLIGVFCVFLPSSLIFLKDGDLPGGNVFLLFTGFVILVGAIGMIAKFFMINAGIDISGAAAVEAWGWLACEIFLLIMTPAFLKAPKLFFLILILADVAVGCIVAMNFGMMNPALGSKLAGILLFLLGIDSFYLVAAITWTTIFGKSPLPII